MQNNQPQANVTDDSDGDIEDETDWLDEVNTEPAPHHKSAKAIEVRSYFFFILFRLKAYFCRCQYGRPQQRHLGFPHQMVHISARLGLLRVPCRWLVGTTHRRSRVAGMAHHHRVMGAVPCRSKSVGLVLRYHDVVGVVQPLH